MSEAHDEFYLRYYVGHHTDRFGHEFMEIELTPSGKLRYANYSNYNSDVLIRKEVYVSPAVVEEIRRIVEESGITGVDGSSSFSFDSACARASSERWSLATSAGSVLVRAD